MRFEEKYNWLCENFQIQQNNFNQLSLESFKNLSDEITKWTEEEILELHRELSAFGPIQDLINDDAVSEILVNRYDQIFYEKNGKLFESNKNFINLNSYLSFIERVSNASKQYLTQEKPFIEVQWNLLRISIVLGELSEGQPVLSIRKKPQNSRNLNCLEQLDFLSSQANLLLKNLISERKNLIIVGPTGAGKTTLLQALLLETDPLDRTVIIEDTQELQRPHPSCLSLITRQASIEAIKPIDMNDLIRRALRLRPDRLVVGEIRGPEAQSLLMALATGHKGSMGSLHAESAAEALFRLEMLIQMGAPQWSIENVRRLLSMTVDYILTTDKVDGKRKLKSIHKVCSFEHSGITLEEIFLN